MKRRKFDWQVWAGTAAYLVGYTALIVGLAFGVAALRSYLAFGHLGCTFVECVKVLPQ